MMGIFVRSYKVDVICFSLFLVKCILMLAVHIKHDMRSVKVVKTISVSQKLQLRGFFLLVVLYDVRYP